MSIKQKMDEEFKNYGGVDHDSAYTIEPPKFRKAVYVSSMVAAVGGFVCGYDTGAISGILAMPTFKNNFFNEDNIVYLQGLLLSLYLMTGALGSFSSGYFCDRFSRKYCIMGASAVFSVGILLQIIGVNFGILLAGRLIGGFGSGVMTNAIPLYHSEIAPADIRGRLISFFTLMSIFGQIAGYFTTFGTSYVDSNWSWRAPWLLHIIVSVLFSLTMSSLPFSPRWLIDKGRYDEAKQVLVELHEVPGNHPLVEEEYENIVTEIEFERSLGDRTFIELFQGNNLKRTLLASFISVSTSFTGSIAIWYYAPQIFQSAGLDDTSTSIAATGGTGILSFITAFISLQYFIDRVGRRPLFLTGAFLMGTSMFVVGALFHVYTIVDVEKSTVTITNHYVRNTIIAFLYIFVAAFQFSWGTASYVYPVEIFNMRTRAKGVSFTVGLHWAFSIMITYCVPLFMAHTVSGVYFFFGSCCCAFFIACWFIPETKGKTLEEMEKLFGAQ